MSQAATAFSEPRAGVAGDASGTNFFNDDRSLDQVLALYMPADLRAHLAPHLSRLGEIAGGRLDTLARVADKNPPVLHHRDRFGTDRQWIDYHPAYREMERIGFGEFGLAAMSHRSGVLGWPDPLPPIAKYACQYLIAQSEFGLLCPISMTDSLTRVLTRFADAALLDRYLPGLLALDPDEALQGAMFMTEKAGGSDVGATETVARQEGGQWRLYGDKWFCSNADADLALALARPQGAPPGTKGLGLFLLPRLLPGGAANAYRIVRLKDKLGTRSIASGEIVLEGAVAYPVGDLSRGFVQMAEMVNVSRLSNGVRSAGMMRRALREALYVARTRVAFGRPLIAFPLMRRQLLKLLVPTEQALSFAGFTAAVMARADAGDSEQAKLLRLLTPLLKLRACRDARKVAADAMEVRGGTGYVEDFVESRLLRDTQLGSIWEGASNIVALDAIQRAVGRHGGADALRAALAETTAAVPEPFRARLSPLIERALRFAEQVAADPSREDLVREAASGLYNAVSAALLAWEGATLGRDGGDARRLLLSALVIQHRLTARDPLAGEPAVDFGSPLLADAPVSLSAASKSVSAAA